MDNFCAECGKELVKLLTGKYDQDTGQPATYAACPTDKCGHTGVKHAFVDISNFWNSGNYSGVCKCAKCGYKGRFLTYGH